MKITSWLIKLIFHWGSLFAPIFQHCRPQFFIVAVTVTRRQITQRQIVVELLVLQKLVVALGQHVEPDAQRGTKVENDRQAKRPDGPKVLGNFGQVFRAKHEPEDNVGQIASDRHDNHGQKGQRQTRADASHLKCSWQNNNTIRTILRVHAPSFGGTS